MKMTNRRNHLIYRIWAPIYDILLEKTFTPGRERAAELLALQPGERVLLVGVGTGGDLPLLPRGIEAVGIDLSPEMLSRAQTKLPLSGRDISFIEGDAQMLPFRNEEYDAVVLSLILSVVPDGNRCLKEAVRVFHQDGRIVIFDKFLQDNKKAGYVRQFLNIFSTLFVGTDINRRFDTMIENLDCAVSSNESSILGGFHSVIQIRRI